MSGKLLPHTLLDLTFARATAGLSVLPLRPSAFAFARRLAHQSAQFDNVPVSEYPSYDNSGDRSLYAA